MKNALALLATFALVSAGSQATPLEYRITASMPTELVQAPGMLPDDDPADRFFPASSTLQGRFTYDPTRPLSEAGLNDPFISPNPFSLYMGAATQFEVFIGPDSFGAAALDAVVSDAPPGGIPFDTLILGAQTSAANNQTGRELGGGIFGPSFGDFALVLIGLLTFEFVPTGADFLSSSALPEPLELAPGGTSTLVMLFLDEATGTNRNIRFAITDLSLVSEPGTLALIVSAFFGARGAAPGRRRPARHAAAQATHPHNHQRV